MSYITLAVSGPQVGRNQKGYLSRAISGSSERERPNRLHNSPRLRGHNLRHGFIALRMLGVAKMSVVVSLLHFTSPSSNCSRIDNFSLAPAWTLKREKANRVLALRWGKNNRKKLCYAF